MLLSLCLCPQSCHQQRPLLRDAGSQEEEGVIHEEALKLPVAPNVALDRAGGQNICPVWAGAEATLRSASDLSRGFL